MLRPSATMASIAGTPAVVAGILTSRLGSLDAFVQVSGGLHGCPSVVGQLGRHLDRDEPVGALAGVEGRPQQPQGVDDVGNDEVPVGVLHGVSGESVWSWWS